MSAIYMIGGKPHRLCDCDQLNPVCARGYQRPEQTCGYGQCFVPADDVMVVGNGLTLSVGSEQPKERRVAQRRKMVVYGGVDNNLRAGTDRRKSAPIATTEQPVAHIAPSDLWRLRNSHGASASVRATPLPTDVPLYARPQPSSAEWVRCPKWPTRDMQIAGSMEGRWSLKEVQDIWEAMLAALPSSPADQERG